MYNATSTATYAAANRMRIGRASEFESDARPMRIRWAEWSQKLRNNNDNGNNDDDNTMNAIWHALTTMMMPFWHHYRCCSMPNVELPQLIMTYHTNSQPKAGILVTLVYTTQWKVPHWYPNVHTLLAHIITDVCLSFFRLLLLVSWLLPYTAHTSSHVFLVDHHVCLWHTSRPMCISHIRCPTVHFGCRMFFFFPWLSFSLALSAPT